MAPTYRYLDLRPGAAAWPGATGLGIVYGEDDDCVRLAPLAGDPTALATELGALAGASSIGVAEDGTIYLADQEGKRILELLCDGTVVPFACLGAEGVLLGPRAVLVGPRDRLYIADSDAVLVVDRSSGTVVDRWEGLGSPVDLAADTADRIYMADAAGGRILRVDADGVRDRGFALAVADPVALVTTLLAGSELLLVVSSGVDPISTFTLDGMPDPAGEAALSGLLATEVTGIAAGGDALYVSTPGGVLAFAWSGAFLGLVAGGSAAALALDRQGRLLVAGDAGLNQLGGQARARAGRLLLGPLPLTDGNERWDRIAVELGEPLAASAHVRLWTRTSATTAAPAWPPATPEPGEQRERTGPDEWRAAPIDAPDALVLHRPAPYLWICLEIDGDGTATPAVRAVRADALGTGLPGRLPAIYAAADADETTERLVQLLAAPIDALEEAIHDLPRDLDAEATPLLDELAAWVAQPLAERLPESIRREHVAHAFERHGHRGTRAALEATLAEAAGTAVRITEPAAETSHWLLGESPLGWRTMLITAEAQGAVVGTTADVDLSHLITDEDVGWPLDADVAHRFCVHVGSALTREREAALRAAVESEKPAHTLASVCIAEPLVRVGSGARVGAEMVVGGRPAPARKQTAAAVGGRVGGIPIGGRQ